MKVQVFSSRKEAVALVGRTWDKDGNELAKYRRFIPLSPKSPIGHSYMTLKEANFLVESDENRKHAASGSPRYYYPSGFPNPLPDDKGAPMAEAFVDGASHNIDERQTVAAQRQAEEKQRVMAAKKAEYNAQVALEAEQQKASSDFEEDKAPSRSRKPKTDEG